MKNKLLLFILLSIVLVASIIVVYINKNADMSAITHYWDKENTANTATIDHAIWQQLLDDYLIIEHPSGVNRVDYVGLMDDKEVLQAYTQNLSSIDPRHYTKKEQMAYWINLYNALTALLIVESYPVESITTLGKTTLAFGPWDDEIITIAKQELTLNDIEHRILRPIWQDNRIHFAVNCASIGCPNLQETAFTAKNLDHLLTKGAKEYLAHPRGLRFNNNTLILSSLFDWYKDDFGRNTAELIAELQQYTPETTQTKLMQFTGDILYEYDWGLNDDNE